MWAIMILPVCSDICANACWLYHSLRVRDMFTVTMVADIIMQYTMILAMQSYYFKP